MSILHVRNVPEELYERIRIQAQAQNRSISAEVITLLQRALAEPDHSQEQGSESIRHRRSFRPAQAGAPDSTSQLRQDREH